MTRSARNWASWSRRRDFEALGVGGELGLDHALAKIGRLVGDLAEPRAQQPEDQTDDAQDDHRPAHQGLDLVDDARGTVSETARALTIRKRKRKTEPSQSSRLAGVRVALTIVAPRRSRKTGGDSVPCRSAKK